MKGRKAPSARRAPAIVQPSTFALRASRRPHASDHTHKVGQSLHRPLPAPGRLCVVTSLLRFLLPGHASPGLLGNRRVSVLRRWLRVWAVIFCALPRPVLIYVFGHELTHALWVWIMGGRVSKFSVGSNGGYIVTDINNFWIALAPYFFPIYSIFVIILYGCAGLFIDVSHYRDILFALIGETWAFHITFTLWMIPKGQTDLTYHGTFFSLVIIYMMNLLILTTLLLLSSRHTGWRYFSHQMIYDAESFAHWSLMTLRHLLT